MTRPSAGNSSRPSLRPPLQKPSFSILGMSASFSLPFPAQAVIAQNRRAIPICARSGVTAQRGGIESSHHAPRHAPESSHRRLRKRDEPTALWRQPFRRGRVYSVRWCRAGAAQFRQRFSPATPPAAWSFIYLHMFAPSFHERFRHQLIHIFPSKNSAFYVPSEPAPDVQRYTPATPDTRFPAPASLPNRDFEV